MAATNTGEINPARCIKCNDECAWGTYIVVDQRNYCYKCVQSELTTLREIVGELGECDFTVCPFCDAWIKSHFLLENRCEEHGNTEVMTAVTVEHPGEDHAPDCLWLRAQAYREGE